MNYSQLKLTSFYKIIVFQGYSFIVLKYVRVLVQNGFHNHEQFQQVKMSNTCAWSFSETNEFCVHLANTVESI